MRVISILTFYLLVCNLCFSQQRHLWVPGILDGTVGTFVYGGEYADPMNGLLVNAFYIYRTTDGGLNWERRFQNNGLDCFVSEVSYPKKNYAFVAIKEGIALSTDDGETWKKKKIFKDSINDSRLSMFDENNGGLVIVTFAKTPTTHLLITEDGWLTSRELHVPKPKNWGDSDNISFHRVVCIAPKVYLVGIYSYKYKNMFYRTTDAGETWELIPDPTKPNRGTSVQVFRYSFINEKEGVMVGPDQDSITKNKSLDFQLTKDGGLTWQPFAIFNIDKNQLPLNDFVYMGNGKLTFITNFIYRTEDGGKTFVRDSILNMPEIIFNLIHNKKGGRSSIFFNGVWHDSGPIPIKSVIDDINLTVKRKMKFW
ncbi:MAG: hypothetical protein IPP08_11845 [Chlorobiota bacterium]|nr:hypothetical protein [Chlorobiota bacterium]QQS66433.1 MAG: hypothetical protein IPP08_11845 [Chlorobiota bacterium]